MRLGWDDASRNADVFARMAEDVGIQAMTVHGRTRMQLYSGKADWAGVARVKQATRLPVIVNGDIDGVPAMNRALAESGADGVMLGRACYGRPWLVGQLAAVVAGQPMPPEPAPGPRLDLILEHYEDMLAHHGVWRGVLAARKHLAWYIRDYPGASELRQRIMGLDEPGAVRAALRAFFAPLPARLAA
jgi:tRNA-dihydrouridine synthase B